MQRQTASGTRTTTQQAHSNGKGQGADDRLDAGDMAGIARLLRQRSRRCFEADHVLRRVQKMGDLFASVLTLKQKLPEWDRIEVAA